MKFVVLLKSFFVTIIVEPKFDQDSSSRIKPSLEILSKIFKITTNYKLQNSFQIAMCKFANPLADSLHWSYSCLIYYRWLKCHFGADFNWQLLLCELWFHLKVSGLAQFIQKTFSQEWVRDRPEIQPTTPFHTNTLICLSISYKNYIKDSKHCVFH